MSDPTGLQGLSIISGREKLCWETGCDISPVFTANVSRHIREEMMTFISNNSKNRGKKETSLALLLDMRDVILSLKRDWMNPSSLQAARQVSDRCVAIKYVTLHSPCVVTVNALACWGCGSWACCININELGFEGVPICSLYWICKAFTTWAEALQCGTMMR